MICGVLTKRGTPCKWDLDKGSCLTHSLDDETLSRRNAKAAKCHSKENLSKWGKKGFKTRVKKLQNKGYSFKDAKLEILNKVAEASLKRRLANPSKSEVLMEEWLTKHDWDFEREWRPLKDRLLTVDFVDHTRKICIEVTSFGKNWIEAEKRENSLSEKRHIVEAMGYRLVFVRFI